MKYDSLDIHQRINLKGALEAWAKYAVQHFGEELDKKVYRKGVYGIRTTPDGHKYRRLGSNNRALRNTWYQNVASERVKLEFLLYGRFLDMGVGNGVSHTGRIVSRRLRHGAIGRKRKPWYSKRKSHEVKRLAEILAERNIRIGLDLVENIMNTSVTINL